MKMSEVKIGMKINHPKHGTGTVTHKYADSVSLLYGKMTVAALTKYEVRSCKVVRY